MNKTIFAAIFALAFLATAGMASAWHCADTDQSQPNWHNGHYGVWGDNNQLGGTTTGWLNANVAVPAGCTGTQGSYTCADTCVEGGLKEFYCMDRIGHSGETIITWTTHSNSPACQPGNDVPEFGVIGAGLVLVGAIGAVLVSRRN